jgi:hypothetical protein
VRWIESTLRAAGMGIALLAMTGCLSAFPLEPAPVKDIDARLTGVWRCLPSDEDATAEAATLTIRRATDRTYAITFEAKGDDTSRYDAYPTDVGGTTILNVKDLGSGTTPWDYARYSFLLPNVLQVRVVQDGLLKEVERTPAAFRDAIRRHLEDPALYGDFCVCVRARDPEPAPQ